MSARYTIGLGLSSSAIGADVIALVDEALAEIDLGRVAGFFTLASKLNHPALLEAAAHFKRPVKGFGESELRLMSVVTPSPFTQHHVGVASVAEAAALCGAGAGARLFLTKRKGSGVTIAIACGEAE